MIAVFLTEPSTVHAVFEILREGLKVKAHGYCGAISNAADGTYQIPEWAFDGRQTYMQGRFGWPVCPKCILKLRELREPPR